jgi:hypothetical protein
VNVHATFTQLYTANQCEYFGLQVAYDLWIPEKIKQPTGKEIQLRRGRPFYFHYKLKVGFGTYRVQQLL